MALSGDDRAGCGYESGVHTWPMRERVAAVIESEGSLLMVRQRARGEAGRHDGPEYLTLPGGGVEAGESPVDAVAREVAEEVGLRVTSTSFLRRVEHIEQTGGATSIFYAEVEEGRATLGSDPDLLCDCPRLVGVEWVVAPTRQQWDGDDVRSLLRVWLS